MRQLHVPAEVVEGCGRLWTAVEGCGGLWTVVEGCHTSPSAGIGPWTREVGGRPQLLPSTSCGICRVIDDWAASARLAKREAFDTAEQVGDPIESHPIASHPWEARERRDALVEKDTCDCGGERGRDESTSPSTHPRLTWEAWAEEKEMGHQTYAATVARSER